MNDLIQVGIVGGSDYKSGELIRLLLNHPAVEIQFVNDDANAGNLLTDVHSGLYGETNLYFTDELPFDKIDVVFFCLEHGRSSSFLAEHYLPADLRIIDLAQDFRKTSEDNDFVYGLPELNRLQLSGAQHIANPGHFATSIQLGILPLATQGWLDGDLTINAITGATVEGNRPSAMTHFPWRSGNISIHKAFRHPQLAEIRQSLYRLQPSFDGELNFLSYRGDFPRGIFTTIVTRCDAPEDEMVDAFKEYYAEADFTQYVDQPIDLKEVINTNKCLIHAEKFEDKVLITSVLDNLLKGAAGQAVQNMNLMFELEETAGLRLKPVVF